MDAYTRQALALIAKSIHFNATVSVAYSMELDNALELECEDSFLDSLSVPGTITYTGTFSNEPWSVTLFGVDT